MSQEYRRGLHPDKNGDENKLLNSILSGKLRNLFEIVRNDDNLVIQIRDNYFNIYYRGGNVAKVNSETSVVVDKNYFRVFNIRSLEDFNEIKRKVDSVKVLFKNAHYQEYLDEVTHAMTNYWHAVLNDAETDEKQCQHNLCLYNSESSLSDYVVLDLEYEVSKRSKFCYQGEKRTKTGKILSPRYDIVAVRKSDGCLCIMELKKGTEALKGKSGIADHIETYENTAGYSEQTQKLFIEEMREVLEQKKQFHLLDSISINCELPLEYLFVFQDNPNEGMTKNEQIRKYKRIKGAADKSGKYRTVFIDSDSFSLKD